MKRFVCIFLFVICIIFLASCSDSSQKKSGSESVGSDEKLNIDSDDSDYDPFAVIDYGNPLTDTGNADRHIPKFNINLNGANTLSDKIEDKCEKDFAKADSITYTYEIQYDVIELVIKAQTGEKTEYCVYYYDALTDTELTVSDFISYCSLRYVTIEDEIERQLGADFDEDYFDFIVYHGDNSYDIYCSDKEENSGGVIYSCEMTKSEIDLSEIMSGVNQ